MLNLTNINSFPTQDFGSLGLLKEIAQKYCPEEAREVRQSVFPDEVLHLEELEAGFKQLLAGGSGYLRITASVSAFLRRRSCATCTTRRSIR